MAKISMPRSRSAWSGSRRDRADSTCPGSASGRNRASGSSNRSISTSTSTMLSPALKRMTVSRVQSWRCSERALRAAIYTAELRRTRLEGQESRKATLDHHAANEGGTSDEDHGEHQDHFRL